MEEFPFVLSSFEVRGVTFRDSKVCPLRHDFFEESVKEALDNFPPTLLCNTEENEERYIERIYIRFGRTAVAQTLINAYRDARSQQKNVNVFLGEHYLPIRFVASNNGTLRGGLILHGIEILSQDRNLVTIACSPFPVLNLIARTFTVQHAGISLDLYGAVLNNVFDLSDGRTLTIEELRCHLSSSHPAYSIPAVRTWVDTIDAAILLRDDIQFKDATARVLERKEAQSNGR